MPLDEFVRAAKLPGRHVQKQARGGSRRYKPFSLRFDAYSSERPVSIAVPADCEIRRALLPASYTAVPWPVSSANGRIDSRKHPSYAGETECRLRDGALACGGARWTRRPIRLNITPCLNRWRT